MKLFNFGHTITRTPDHDDIRHGVEEWASNRNLIEHSYERCLAQLNKTREELDEIQQALKTYFEDCTDENLQELELEYGDAFVTLIIGMACAGTCSDTIALEKALKKISKRTGKVVDGQFVKDKY